MSRPGEPMSPDVPTKGELRMLLHAAWESGSGFAWPNSLTYDEWLVWLRSEAFPSPTTPEGVAS